VQTLVARHAGEAMGRVTHGDLVAALIGHAVGTPAEQRYAKHTVPTGAASEIIVGSAGVWTFMRQASQ